ncbi:MAG: glycosyltransferase involved in cell wall biosynthesis [Rhodothermales bacterium]|jgi:glycosyltransferase involved in cell wall biosynthesis
MPPKIIFHYPGPFYDILDTGEKKRPMKLLRAFQEMDCQLTVVMGTNAERQAKVSEILDNGLSDIAGYYLESSNMPVYLTEGTGLFHNPDLRLMKAIIRSDVPSSLFYRDAHWLKPEFQRKLGFKKWPSLFLYRRELAIFRQFDLMYVPSVGFGDMLPGKLPPTAELPSGTDCPDVPPKEITERLNLVYMGNVEKPYWDISTTLKMAENLAEQVELTIITPEKNLQYLRSSYDIPKTVQIRHLVGEELTQELLRADIGLMFEPDNDYSAKSVNVKFYEYIGHGLPVVAYKGSRCAELLIENNAGWVIAPGGLEEIIRTLLKSPKRVAEKSSIACEARTAFSWKSRAQTIIADFAQGRNASRRSEEEYSNRD